MVNKVMTLYKNQFPCSSSVGGKRPKCFLWILWMMMSCSPPRQRIPKTVFTVHAKLSKNLWFPPKDLIWSWIFPFLCFSPAATVVFARSLLPCWLTTLGELTTIICSSKRRGKSVSFSLRLPRKTIKKYYIFTKSQEEEDSVSVFECKSWCCWF